MIVLEDTNILLDAGPTDGDPWAFGGMKSDAGRCASDGIQGVGGNGPIMFESERVRVGFHARVGRSR